MPPSTMTEVSLIQKPVSSMPCQECSLPHKSDDCGFNNNNEVKEPCPYESSRPSNESKLFSRLRKWEKDCGFETSLQWKNIVAIILFHVVTSVCFLAATAMGIFPKWQTGLFSLLCGHLAGFGVTAGAHRYWCHRSFKANKPLQVILMLCYSMAGQNKIFDWVRDHRVHHKYSETSADPHDARRGFFFSHVGWLMMRKHPHVLREGRKLDLSDVACDPIVQFHTRYFTFFKLALCFVLPIAIPIWCWQELWWYSVLASLVRYMCSLNFTWAVNSFAHMWGNKPYDRFMSINIDPTVVMGHHDCYSPVVFLIDFFCITYTSSALLGYKVSFHRDFYIMPVENWCVSIFALGEGWHNYHHTFPWDYKAAELGDKINVTTVILDWFARIGWAYDMKQASPSLIEAVAMKRGDREH